MRLAWNPRALADLSAIDGYLLEEAGPLKAIEVIEEIRAQARRLLDHPQLGRRGRLQGTRELVIRGLPYVIPYRVADEEVIELLRVYHTARQWPPTSI